MKILYFCATYHKGHLFFDERIIELLSKVSDLTVISPKDWYHKLDNVTYIEEAFYKEKVKFAHLGLFNITSKNYRLCKKYARKFGVDYVVAGEYELISIFLFKLFFRKKVFLVNHYNVDQIERSFVFRTIFNMIKKHFYHVVLEDYIKDLFVEKYKILPQKVYCWHHPSIEYGKNKENAIYDCIATSGSNDLDIIDKIIEIEKESATFKNNNLHVLLKSLRSEYDDGYLKVVKGKIEQKEFDKIFASAKSLFIPLPDSYQYRVSAVVMTAVARHIPVIGTDVALINFYKKKYPSVFSVSNGDDLSEIILKLDSTTELDRDKDIQKFCLDHSMDVVLEEVRGSFVND